MLREYYTTKPFALKGLVKTQLCDGGLRLEHEVGLRALG
jgi:hypothetical protein